MEKKEKKSDLEQLLNSLIEKGWKPFGRNYCKYKNGCLYYIVHTEDGVWSEGRYGVSLRELVSKESGLWQFVCDKGLVKKDGDINKDMEKYMYKCEYMDGCGNTINYWKRSKFTHHYFYEYFIIESALCDEDKLEEFLLSNIKVDETK